jgi:large subunit ribosomal protein L4
MEINVVNMKNEQVESVELPEQIASAGAKKGLIYELVRQYQTSGRQGTHATKNRALVSGSGRKLWRQKGTGRARIGSLRSPLWRHGGTVFGPQPRDYAYDVPAAKRIAAFRAVFSGKIKENRFVVVDEINLEQPRTKAALDLISVLQLPSRTTLFVDYSKNKNLQLAVRNLPNAKFSTLAAMNIVDLLKYKNVVISKQAFTQLTRMLAK